MNPRLADARQRKPVGTSIASIGHAFNSLTEDAEATETIFALKEPA